MEVKGSQQIARCDMCTEIGINLNYLVVPNGNMTPSHVLLCSVCTAKQVNEFLNRDKK
jgi:hypothetical protein